MDAQTVQLLLASIESVKTELKDELSNLKEDVIKPLQAEVDENADGIRELLNFKWKLIGVAIATGGGTGVLGFTASKYLDKLF